MKIGVLWRLEIYRYNWSSLCMSVSMTGWPLVAVISVLQIGHSSGEC